MKDFVFILNDYKCNKNCSYCIAKMNNKNTSSFEEEIKSLKNKISYYKNKKISFEHFILSGNGETSLYDLKKLEEIKTIVENSKIFKDYRIQTSGNLFCEQEKLNLFSGWLKEITVVSSNALKDKEFFGYNQNYLELSSFLNAKRVRVNIVLLNNNVKFINRYIDHYSNMQNVETIALKFLDNSNNGTKQSLWIKNNALAISEIDNVINNIITTNKLKTFSHKRFIFETKNNKPLTIHFSTKNTYDEINVNQKFSFHEKNIKKGVYGEFSKVEEEVEEEKDALQQQNHLMYLIELSDIIGAVEKIAENYGLTIHDLIKFSNKVKESKKYE